MTEITATRTSGWARRVSRPIVGVAKYLLAVIATQIPIAAIVLLGYVYAFMQRRSFAVWGVPTVADDQNLLKTLRGRITLGVSGALITFALSAPYIVAWSVSWFAGWNISFDKSYEQAGFGAGVGLLGVLLFCLTMPYLQFAQARHAVTANWRVAFEARTNLRLLASAPMRSMFTGVLYAVAGLPLAVLFVLPLGFPQMIAEYESLSDAEVRERIGQWYLFGGALFVPMLFLVKRFVATTYARAVARSLAQGRIHIGQLTDVERDALTRAGQVTEGDRQRSARTRVVVVYAASAVLWFAVVAQVFISQFLNYHGAAGFANQPLIQLPWVSRIPDQIADA